MPSESKRGEPLPRNVWLLGLASLLNDTASEAIFSLTPAFLRSMGGTPQHLGVIEGLADSVAALLKLKAGTWSDRLGARRIFVILGYAVAALIRPLVAFATVPWHLVSIRLVDRIGKGVRSAPRDALLADSVPETSRGRAFGLRQALDHVGAAVGPLLAAAFLYFLPGQERWLFGLTIIPGLLVLVAVLLVREERVETKAGKQDDEPNDRRLPGRFRWYLVAVAVFALGSSSDAFLLNRCLDVGLSAVWLPAIWCMFHIAKSAGNVIVGRLIDRIGPRWPLVIGWLLYAAVYLGFAASGQPWQVIALFMVYSVFYALTEPAEKTLVAQLVPAEQRGQAFGWFHFATGILILPANLLFGWLYAQSAWLAFGFGAGCGLVACLMAGAVLGLSRNHRVRANDAGD